MIESVKFRNLKVLKDAQLPLNPFTLIVGANGSGKTTALQTLQSFTNPTGSPLQYPSAVSVGNGPPGTAFIETTIMWGGPNQGSQTINTLTPDGQLRRTHKDAQGTNLQQGKVQFLENFLRGIRVYALDAVAIAQPSNLQPNPELMQNGGNFAMVLENLRDEVPERFEALNQEMARWLPEYDRILLNTPGSGKKGVSLRTRLGKHPIPAWQLSQGALLALGILTLSYLPHPPSLVGLEEPDRGVHPRLLRDLQAAMYRLSFPADFGEDRAPVQVVATTHSPYLLDLYRDHPEQIVIAHRKGNESQFERLADRPEIREIVANSPLGQIWYSGILGGVPGEP